MKVTRRGLFSVMAGGVCVPFVAKATEFAVDTIGEVPKYYISDNRLIEVGSSKPVGGDPEVGFYGDGSPFIYDKWYNDRHLIIRH